MAYDDANVFAKILRGEMPCERVYEDEHTLAFMDIMPRGDGHLLVIPKRPARGLLDAEPESLSAVIRTVQAVGRAAKQGLGADGLTIQQFNESAGGQVVFHLHFHVIPRWNGVPLRPHTGEMAAREVLTRHATAIREALSR